MHIYTLHRWEHNHQFTDVDTRGERNTRRVILLTVVMMVVEVSAGYVFGSMALLADGWHMGTHAIALGITALAYYYARRHADDPNYSFGTGKVGVLGGFVSAVVLAVIALMMGAESIQRLFSPQSIRFNEAIIVAVVGLTVNLISAYLLQDKTRHPHHHDHHGHESDHAGAHRQQDHNLRAAYLHVLADALTSVLAIAALSTGKAFGWVWMDPIMGMVGAVIIIKWSYGLLTDTGKILLDRDVNIEQVRAIQSKIESDSDNRVADIHVWRVGSRHLSAIISIVTHFPKPPEYYKKLLSEFQQLSHVTIEVNECREKPCIFDPRHPIS